MKDKNKTILIITLTIVTALLLGVGLFYAAPDLFGKKPQTVVIEPSEPVEINVDHEKYKKIWKENHDINPDYVGELFFDSGLIDVSFVQAKSTYDSKGELYKFYTEDGRLVSDPTGYTGNDVYIWTYWKTGAYDYNDNGGSVFMDYRNDIDDQNLIIYGHHFSVWNDATRKKAFTPIEQLLEAKNYSPNRYVTMVLEKEIRHYELVSVYQFDATKDRFWQDFQYWRTNYNYDDYTETKQDDYFANYIKGIKEVQLYDTGVELTTNDNTLTLQTCISGHTGELFQILVLKEIQVEKYN